MYRDIPQSPQGRNFYIYFFIIVIITVLIYYPLFFYFFADFDTLKYFLETQNTKGLQLLTKYFSYNAVSRYGQGDTITFRPLFFAFLGLQKNFFGVHYVLWQIFNILLHLGVVLSLYRLLSAMGKSIFAWLLCSLFSTYTIFRNVVAWPHISGYLLYLILILNAVYFLYKYTLAGEDTKSNLFSISLSMLFACFLYETGFIFCLLFALYIRYFRKSTASRDKSLGYLIILIPAFLFLLAFILDKFSGKNLIMEYEMKKVFNFQNFFASIKAVPAIFFLWVKRGFFLDSTYIGGKFSTSFFSFSLRYALLIFSFLFLIINLFVSFRERKNYRLFSVLILSMILVHLAVNCFGRIGTHGPIYLVYNTRQTSYIFWALLLAFIYSAVDFEIMKNYYKSVWYLGAASLLIFITFNASMTYRLNRVVEKERKPVRAYMAQLTQFVRGHDREKDFSFNVVPPSPWVLQIIDGYLDPRKNLVINGEFKKFTYEELFFSRYYKKENPKYVLHYDVENNWLTVNK